jgi:hypothetical protein
VKERNNLKKTKTKKDERYKSLLNQVGSFYWWLMINNLSFQIESLKTSERQLKLKVKSLANEIELVSKK